MNEPPIPSVTVIFLYYFSMTTLIVIFVISQGMAISLKSQLPYQIGISLGLVVGLIGAYIKRSVIVTLKVSHPKPLISRLEETLTELGFQNKSQLEDYTIYTKSGLASLFAGKIFLKIDKKSITLIGRSRNIKYLQQIIA